MIANFSTLLKITALKFSVAQKLLNFMFHLPVAKFDLFPQACHLNFYFIPLRALETNQQLLLNGNLYSLNTTISYLVTDIVHLITFVSKIHVFNQRENTL